MEVQNLSIPDVKLIRPTVLRDERGTFSETYSQRAWEAHGFFRRFVQDNHSLSLQKGVVRGLHFQVPPHAQDKLVRVTRGSVFDVALDLRVGSPSYGQHVSAILSAANGLQMLVPQGFAHGFCTLEPCTEVIYKVTDHYAPESDRGVLWSDPRLRIEWPVLSSEALLSPKDQAQPSFAELPVYFQYAPSSMKQDRRP